MSHIVECRCIQLDKPLKMQTCAIIDGVDGLLLLLLLLVVVSKEDVLLLLV